jgi:hypothetical protein
MTERITECSRLPINRGRIILGLSLENWLACPVLRDKLQVKFIFGKEQLQFEGSYISRLDMYLERSTWRYIPEHSNFQIVFKQDYSI